MKLVVLVVLVVTVLVSSMARGEDDRFAVGQLTAADVDDNINFPYYLKYMQRKEVEYSELLLLDNSERQTWQNWYLPITSLGDRIPLQIMDANGEPFSCAELQFGGQTIPATTSGKVYIFPTLDGLKKNESYLIVARPPNGTCPADCVSKTITTNDIFTSTVTVMDALADTETASTAPGTSDPLPSIRDVVQLQITSRNSTPPVKLDLALLFDTTGSMCDELEYLKTELAQILQETTSGVDVRLAYIAYKSAGDEYEVKVKDFGIPNFEDELATEACDGGGNGELVDLALLEASRLEWRTGNVARMVLIVGDEPPHGDLYYDSKQAFSAALELRRLGIRLYGLAASTADPYVQYLFRLFSFITGARYLWLTDDSGIGGGHAEPDVLCYQVTHLDKLLNRVIRSELTGKRVEIADPADIIRESGHQTAGICLYDLNEKFINGAHEIVADSIALGSRSYDSAAASLFQPFMIGVSIVSILLCSIFA